MSLVVIKNCSPETFLKSISGFRSKFNFYLIRDQYDLSNVENMNSKNVFILKDRLAYDRLISFTKNLSVCLIYLGANSSMRGVKPKTVVDYSKEIDIEKIINKNMVKVAYKSKHVDVINYFLSKEDKSFLQKFYTYVYTLPKTNQQKNTELFLKAMFSRNPLKNLEFINSNTTFGEYIRTEQGKEDIKNITTFLNSSSLDPIVYCEGKNITPFDLNYLKSKHAKRNIFTKMR